MISCAVHFCRADAESLSEAQAQALVTRALGTEIRVARDPNHLMRYLKPGTAMSRVCFL
jgi:hypothetical protein